MATTTITVSIQRCQILAFKPDDILMPKLDAAIAYASGLNMPVEMCRQNFVDARILEEIVQKIGEPKVGEPRKILLICGAFLEEQISLAAQYMLVTGFAVYLLRELVFVKSPEHANIHDLRLIQAGAILTTLQQLVYEWLATETNESIRGSLREMYALWRPA
jgi:hypothetical protein